MAKAGRHKPLAVKKSKIEVLTYDQALTKLKSVKKDRKEYLKGHRKVLYRFLQRAVEIAVSVESDENSSSRFRKKMHERDVLRGVLLFIFDAKSTSAAKMASKRALALRYLLEKLKVAVEDIAASLPKNGGVEKLARLAAKTRQDDDQDHDDEDEGDDDNEDRHEDETEEADESDEVKPKLGRQIRVGLSPKLSKKLNGLSDKTRIKIIGYVRAPPDELPTIEAERLIQVRANKKDEKPKDEATAKKPHEDERDWYE